MLAGTSTDNNSALLASLSRFDMSAPQASSMLKSEETPSSSRSYSRAESMPWKSTASSLDSQAQAGELEHNTNSSLQRSLPPVDESVEAKTAVVKMP